MIDRPDTVAAETRARVQSTTDRLGCVRSRIVGLLLLDSVLLTPADATGRNIEPLPAETGSDGAARPHAHRRGVLRPELLVRRSGLPAR